MGVSMVVRTAQPRAAHRTPYVRWVKPLFDRVVAAALLVVLAPVFVVVALAVRLNMGRGVSFRQRRVGRGGEREPDAVPPSDILTTTGWSRHSGDSDHSMIRRKAARMTAVLPRPLSSRTRAPERLASGAAPTSPSLP